MAKSTVYVDVRSSLNELQSSDDQVIKVLRLVTAMPTPSPTPFIAGPTPSPIKSDTTPEPTSNSLIVSIPTAYIQVLDKVNA